MALEAIQEKYAPKDNDFYREHYHHVIMVVMGIITFLILMVCVVLYQVIHLPLPQFNAIQKDGSRMLLIPYNEPNLLPDTILRWGSKAATTAYTFDFVHYQDQVKAARPYFTNDGWQDYLRSVNALIATIVQKQLFVNGIVSGPPVISNEGPLPGREYVWRIQIPFLVTYQSANSTSKRNYFVTLTIVRVPTDVNPQGIGIDQFVME